MKVAEAVVQILSYEGISDVFGIPGAGINPVYKYLKDAPMKHYCMRHEEACAHAADGYFRASHKIALAICTGWPWSHKSGYWTVYGFYRLYSVLSYYWPGKYMATEARTISMRGYC